MVEVFEKLNIPGGKARSIPVLKEIGDLSLKGLSQAVAVYNVGTIGA